MNFAVLPVDLRARRRWQGYLVCGVLAALAYLVAAPSLAADVLYTVVALSMPVAATYGIRRDSAPGWWWLVGGLWITGSSEFAYMLLVSFGLWPSGESWLAVPFLVGGIVHVVGLIRLGLQRAPGSGAASWLDAASVGVATLVVVWQPTRAAISSDQTTLLDQVALVGYPITGLATFVLSLRLAFLQRRWNSAFAVLFFGFGLSAFNDILTNAMMTYTSGLSLDVVWLAGYVLIGAATLMPSRLEPPKQAPTSFVRREINLVLGLQTLVILVLIGTVASELDNSIDRLTIVVWSVCGVTMLGLNRMRVYSLLRMSGEASTMEHERLLGALVTHSHDVIGLADSDGTIRFASPSLERLTGQPADMWIGRRLDRVTAAQLDGLNEVFERALHLQPGSSNTWEGPVTNAAGARRIVQVTVANHLETPEVKGWVLTVRDVTDAAELTSQLRHQALHDALTDLPNRTLFADRIQHALARSHRDSQLTTSIALVDVDDFKSVNDSLGHDVGDELLQGVARRLAQAVRPTDTVARLGGDEFAVLLEDTDEASATVIAERIIGSLALPIAVRGTDFAVMASVGLVTHVGWAEPTELLRSADIAMYAAKRDGKGRVRHFREHMHDAARNELLLRMDLAVALTAGQLSLAYQPILNARQRTISGFEALLRWHHPERGPVPPNEFIPLAEQSGLIVQIGEWVLREACHRASCWHQSGGNAPYVSVNVSAMQLADSNFVRTVMDALASSRLEPSRLVLEITESMLVEDGALARRTLSQLRSMGVRVAIDDFGTGYSSLAFLRELQVDIVKIDQAFVRDLAVDDDRKALTRTMLSLADGLSMTAIAEGVEAETELAELLRMGCGFAQGYLFSKPVAAVDLDGFLASVGLSVETS